MCGKTLERKDLFNKFKNRHISSRKTCSDECESKIHSLNLQGVKNPNQTMTKEVKQRKNKKQSMLLKNRIKNGDFTPCVTNSWAKSRVYVNKIPFRSSWEAIFYIINPCANFETVRIPYKFNGEEKTYIVDFEIDGKLFEIKPKSELMSNKNFEKFKSAKEFSNGLFEVITEEYFKEKLSLIKVSYANIKDSIEKDSRRKIERTINQFTKSI